MANEKNLIPITSETAKELGAKGGRAKKGSKHLSTRIKEFLTDETFVQKLKDKDGKEIEIKGEQLEAIMRTLVIKARNGDTQAAKLLFENGWGSKISIDHTSSDGSMSLSDKLTAYLDGNMPNTKE